MLNRHAVYVNLLFYCLPLIISACGSRISSDHRSPSQLADVVIEDPVGVDYDNYEFKLESVDQNGFTFEKKGNNNNEGQLKAQVPPGTYHLVLAYFKNGRKTYAADLCSDQLRNDRQSLKPGKNDIKLNICNEQKNPIPTKTPTAQDPTKDPQNTADISITPVPQTTPNDGNTANGTFSLRGTELLDPKGNPFVIRGVNTPNAYFKDSSYSALPQIKSLGFNTVRIVWCADTLVNSSRCDAKDFHTVAELEQILSRLRSLNLVAILNLQNATGSNSVSDLQKLVQYLTREDVKRVLLRYRDLVMINIANEWYGQTDKTDVYRTSYQEAIKVLRKSQIDHLLIIDAKGWGQDISSAVDDGLALAKFDQKVLISVHMYERYAAKDVVLASFADARNKKVPLLIGEFGCSHGYRGSVDCDTIINEATKSGQKIGLVAWSYTGNSDDLNDLNLVSPSDWKTLTNFGQKIAGPQSQFMSDAKLACYFNSSGKCD